MTVDSCASRTHYMTREEVIRPASPVSDEELEGNNRKYNAYVQKELASLSEKMFLQQSSPSQYFQSNSRIPTSPGIH